MSDDEFLLDAERVVEITDEGRSVPGAIVKGERNPDKLLALVRPGVKATPDKLRAGIGWRPYGARSGPILPKRMFVIDTVSAGRSATDGGRAASGFH